MEQPSSSAPALARFQLLAAALLFSTGGAAIKSAALTPWQIAGFRSGVAAIAVLLLVPAARRGWSWRVGLVSIGYASTLILFVLANRLTTAANAIFLQATAPFYLLLLGPWLLAERVRKSDLLVLAAIAAGLALFFVAAEPPTRTAPDPGLGNWIAAATGLTWALTIAGLRWVEMSRPQGQHGIAVVAAGNLLAFLVALPMALPVVSARPADWLVIAYLGVFQIGLAYVLVTRAVRGVPALEASLLLMAEPAFNPVWAFLVHQERPAVTAIAGGALILGATMARAASKR